MLTNVKIKMKNDLYLLAKEEINQLENFVKLFT